MEDLEEEKDSDRLNKTVFLLNPYIIYINNIIFIQHQIYFNNIYKRTSLYKDFSFKLQSS